MAVTDAILAQAEQFIIESILQSYAESEQDLIDLRPGTPQYDLFVGATLPVVARIIDLVNAADRKRTILNYTEMTDAEVEAVGDRFFVQRGEGRKSAGSVRIKFLAAEAVTLTPQVEFKRAGLTYHPKQVLEVGATELAHEAVLGYYYADVALEAAENGAAYDVGVGTPFASDTYDSNPNVIEVVSVGPFFGGQDKEPVSDYYLRIRLAAVVRNLVNRLSIRTVLSDRFPGVISRLQVVGNQDPEMLRDRIRVIDAVLGEITLALGGHTDIYVRTPIVRQTVEIYVEAGQFELDLSAYRAVLKVHSVSIKGNPNVSPYFRLDGSTPALRYSALDPVKLIVDPGLTNESLLVDISYAPDVAEIHAFVNSDENRITNANHLVRYFHPIWLAGNVYVQGTTEGSDLGRAAIVRYLDTLVDDESKLIVSKLTEAIYQGNALNVLQDFSVLAQIYYGDGTSYEVSSESVIEIPDDLPRGFSQRISTYVNEAILLLPMV